MSILAYFIILGFIIVLAIGLLWMFPTMPPALKKTVIVAAVVMCILITLVAFGVWKEIRDVQVPQVQGIRSVDVPRL